MIATHNFALTDDLAIFIADGFRLLPGQSRCVLARGQYPLLGVESVRY